MALENLKYYLSLIVTTLKVVSFGLSFVFFVHQLIRAENIITIVIRVHWWNKEKVSKRD